MNNPLIAEMIETANHALSDLTERVTDVKYGFVETRNNKLVETILFKLDGIPHKGLLRGRNASVLLMGNPDDRRIAVRVLIDNDAQPITVNSSDKL